MVSGPVRTIVIWKGSLISGCGPSSDRTTMTGVAVTQRLTCSQQHSHYEVEHREPLEAITLPLYTAEVITGQERKSRRISRSRDFSFAKRSGQIRVVCWRTAGLEQEFVLRLKTPCYTNLYISIQRPFQQSGVRQGFHSVFTQLRVYALLALRTFLCRKR